MPLYKLSWYGDDDISAAHASLFDGKLETYQNKMHDIMLKNKNLSFKKVFLFSIHLDKTGL